MFTTPFIDRQTGHSEGQRFPVNFPPPNVSARNPDNSVNWAQFAMAEQTVSHLSKI
jgi:hypothetical protein